MNRKILLCVGLYMLNFALFERADANVCRDLFAQDRLAAVKRVNAQVPVVFQSEAPLKVELQAAFIKPNSYREGMRFDGKDAIFRQTEIVETETDPAEDMYESAKLRYASVEGQSPVELDIEWRTRGRMRRSDPIPPISIRLPKDSKDPMFAGLSRKIKLVLHGSDAPGPRDMASGRSNQLVAGELLSYKLIEALGISAVRTRLLHVRYLEPGGRYLTEGSAILLEPTKTIGKRLKLEEKDWETEDGDEYILQRNFPVEDFTRQALAQAMLGHADWGPAYNTIQMVVPGTDRSTLVGYDFDQTMIARLTIGDELDPSVSNFDQATFVSTDAKIQEIIDWRADQYPDEKLDFDGAFRKSAAEFLARKIAVLDVAKSASISPEAKTKIVRHLEHFFSELAKVRSR